MLSRRISSLLAIKNSFSFHTLSKNKSNVGITQFVSKPCYSFAYPSHTKITMAALSPTMKTGNIVKWLKKSGDKLSPGDVLFEVETDKATVGYEMQEEGYLANILVPEGTKDVSVGSLIAIVVNKLNQVTEFANYKAAGEEPVQSATAAPPKVEKKAAPPAKSSKSYPKHQKVNMPALSPTMKKGKIIKWLKKEGDKLSPGDILCDVETDKATVGFEIQDEAYLARILVPDNEEISLGELVAIFVEKSSDVSSFKSFSLTSSEEPESVEAPQGVELQAGERQLISPLAKKIAAENKISLADLNIKGSGPDGRILKGDVELFIAQGGVKKTEAATAKVVKAEVPSAPKPAAKAAAPTPSAAGQYVDIPLTNMRKVIAERLLESKTTIPHYYLSISVQMDESLSLREKLNKESKVKISVNDFIIKAVSLACRDVPEANSQWLGDKIRKFKNCDCSVAVSTDSGLITPIVFNANLKGLMEIASNTKELADKARKSQLKPQEFQGGTFTISNLGMFGIDQFIAVINPPQSCILAVGKTEKKLVPVDVTGPNENPYKVINSMNVTLSCDHRVVDGAIGAKWLQAFKDYIEKPYKMLL